MSTKAEMPSTCSLLNVDQHRGAVEERRCIAPFCFLHYDVFSVSSRKTLSYARKKSLHEKVILDFHHQIIVSYLLA